MGGFLPFSALFMSLSLGNSIPGPGENNLPKYRNCVAVQKYAMGRGEILKSRGLSPINRSYDNSDIPGARVAASYFIY